QRRGAGGRDQRPRRTHLRTAGVAIIVPVREGIAYRPGGGAKEHPTTVMMAVALAYGYGVDVAVMVTVGGPHSPNAARPLEKIVTVLGCELVQRTLWLDVPVTCAWKSMSCSGPSVATAGMTTTWTAGPTSSVAVSATPPTSAVIRVLPSASATALPSASTLATPGLRLRQVTGWGGSRLPLTSNSRAVNRVCMPTPMKSASGVSSMAPTGGGSTRTSAVPSTPSLAAVITAVPGVRPTTSPSAVTPAT